MAKSRQKTKDETRRALLDAGAELFAREGLDGPSLDAICEHAGYTRGAFYVHFDDRDDFLAAVMEDVGGPVLDAIMSIDGRGGLDAIATNFLTSFADGSYPLGPSGGIRPHQLLDACARSERVREMYVRLILESIERIERAMETDQSAGKVRDDVYPRQTAELTLALVVGVQLLIELGVDLDLTEGAALLRTLLTTD